MSDGKRRGVGTSTVAWLVGACLLLLGQLAFGTDPIFAVEVFAYVLLTGLGMKVVGGFSTFPGICICYMAMQHVIISQIAKVYYGEPAQTYLEVPTLTMAVYDTALASLVAGSWVAVRLVGRRAALFGPELDLRRLFYLSVVCNVIGALAVVVSLAFSHNTETGQVSQGGIAGLLRSVNFIAPLAISSGTAYVILSSRKRHSVSLLNGGLIALTAAQAIIGGNRALMANGLIVYGVTAIYFGYRFRVKHIVALLIAAYVLQYILFPYALLIRNAGRKPRFEDNVRIASSLLLDVLDHPGYYRKAASTSQKQSLFRYDYYGTGARDTLERYTLITSDDAVIAGTLSEGQSGMETITPGFQMILPTVLEPNKPQELLNTVAHRAPDMVGQLDYNTGITLGYECDAFAAFGWTGVIVISALIGFGFNLVFPLIFAKRMQYNVYAAAFACTLAWPFSEEAVASMVILILQAPINALPGLWILGVAQNLLVTGRLYFGFGRPRSRPLPPAALPAAGPMLLPEQARY